MRQRKTTEWEVAVGKTIQRLRLARGLSQSQLARAAGVSFRSLQNYEQGWRPTPLAVAAKLADALDCTIDELAGRTPKARKKEK
jgi:transcriptional regulator with XRE-family HTH domain